MQFINCTCIFPSTLEALKSKQEAYIIVPRFDSFTFENHILRTLASHPNQLIQF